ncbi:MAG: hypothetical protein IID46_02495 [Planctomycetes bacterium]|nr:hypothetical protein [Planctomycetota bacterium]
MKTFVASAVLLGMIQQTLADDVSPPKYIPPLPKPAVVKPASAPPPIFNLRRLISPAPDANFVVPRLEHRKFEQPQPVLYSAPLPKRIEEATRANVKKQHRSGVTSFIHRAKHVSAKELARSLGRKFAMNQVINVSLQKNKANALLVIIPEEKTNQLIITTSSWNVDEIKRLVSEIDRKPKQFQIDATITVTADGKQIVMRPKITITEGQKSVVSIDSQGIQFELDIHNVRELTQPQHTSPSVKKASAEKISPRSLPAIPTPASYRLIARKPSSLNVYRALSASFRPIHYLGQPREKKEPIQKSERKKEIQHALDKQISLHFEDAALIDVIKHIAQSAGINVVLDNMGLEEEGLTSDTKVSIDVTEIRLKSALNLLLKPRRLAYMIEDEVLKITGKSRVQRPMTTVNYPVGNLLAVPSPDHAAISFDTLINLITSLVEPNSWSERGGQGVITQFDTTLSLVIRQTDQGHAKIKKLLDSLREAKQNDSE